MITIDITMLIQIVNIFILIGLLNIVLYRPIRGILQEREKQMHGMNKDIESYHKNAKMRLEEFDDKIADARSQAKNEFENAKSQAQSAGSEEIAGVRTEVDKYKNEQLAQIESQIKSAGEQLKGQVETFANEIASKVMGRAL